jgi:hypothetical protein
LFLGNRPGPITLTAAKNRQCFSEPISVTASSANANTIKWQLGNGAGDSSRQFVFSAKPPQRGIIFIKATPYFNGCAGITDSVQVEIIGVQANFRFQNTCADKATFAFRNTSSGVVNQFQWSFEGADTTTNASATIITFPPVGAFQAKMVVFQSSTNCYDSITQTIYTYRPSLNTPDSLMCRNSSYIVNVKGAPLAPFATYAWNVAGVSASSTRDSVRTVRPLQHGIFNSSVIIRLNSSYCNDTLLG